MQINPISMPIEMQVKSSDAELGFGRFETYLESVNKNLINANDSVDKYLTSDEVSIHQVMLELSSAKSKMQMLVEVRNRLLEGFNEVMRMQI